MTDEEKQWIKVVNNDDGRIDGLRVQRIKELEAENASLRDLLSVGDAMQRKLIELTDENGEMRQVLKDLLAITRAVAPGAGKVLEHARVLAEG